MVEENDVAATDLNRWCFDDELRLFVANGDWPDSGPFCRRSQLASAVWTRDF